MVRLLVILGLSLVACDRNDDFSDAPSVEAPAPVAGATPAKVGEPSDLPQGHPPLPQAGAALPASPVHFKGVEEFGKVGALLWTAPAEWEARKPSSSMRLAEYILSGSAGAAELTIFYFGPGGGGGVDANISRWIGQFTNADGSAAKGDRSVIEGPVKTYLVQSRGTFNAGMAGSGPPKEDQRMLGAIAESPVGLYFFKLVGPEATVEEHSAAFDGFVKSFQAGNP